MNLYRKLKNNLIAYYLLLVGASAMELRPYYHTFVYSIIRSIANSILRAKLFLPKLSIKFLSVTVLSALILTQVININAFEAHVINATATIVNDIPQILSDNDESCNVNGANITITSTLTEEYTIVYTTDGTDPVCPDTEYVYTAPFTIYETTIIKARTCHGLKQSAIAARTFQITQPAPETCDGFDNDCNGTIDDVFQTILATSTPNLVRLNDLTNVTPEKTLDNSDDIYTTQSSTDLIKFIYLNWVFPQIDASEVIASSTFYLEHHETKSSATLEWWNGSAYQEVCFFPNADTDTIDTCNLNDYLTSGNEARNAAFRLKVGRKNIGDTAIESLDWAELDIEYTRAVNCSLNLCGNGALDDGETCDDGNQLNQDGCSSTCQIEPATSCVKINEVYYDVDNSHGAEYDNEWVELYNACGFPVNLENWTLHDNSISTTTIPVLNLASSSFAVLSPSDTTWPYWNNIPDEAEKIVLGNRIGNGLGNTGDYLILKDNNSIIADQMSYGNDDTIFILSEPAPITTAGRSIARIVKGIDTDTAEDWAYIANPNPGTNPHNLPNNSLIINVNLDDFVADTTELIVENEINKITGSDNTGGAPTADNSDDPTATNTNETFEEEGSEGISDVINNDTTTADQTTDNNQPTEQPIITEQPPVIINDNTAPADIPAPPADTSSSE